MAESRKDKLAFVLLERILDLVKDSGANQTEALCALRAAEALLPETDLGTKPTTVIRT